MDYRLSSVLDMARSKASREKMRAENYRAGSKSDDSTDGMTYEVQIATALGAQSAYEWCVGQLETFDIEPAGGPPPPQAPVFNAESTSSDSSAGVRKVRQQLKAAMDYCDAATRNGQNYGWYDAASYVTAAKEQLSAARDALDEM